MAEPNKKYITEEIFDVKMSVVNEKLDNISHQIEIMGGLNERVVVNRKDIDSNLERLRRLEENQAKIVWAVIGTVLAVVVNFALRGGFMR